MDTSDITPRTGMPDPHLEAAAFRTRYLAQFADPAFEAEKPALERIADIAWAAYEDGRKAPRTARAGPDYADPAYQLSLDWLAARQAIHDAQARHDDAAGPARLLLINGSGRSEHSCPGEMSKSWRLLEIARAVLAGESDVVLQILDLSRLTTEYGRKIHPCKACFSTAAPLCHWPCSCYPNHALGQTQDWMAEIYPLWVEAHGVLIVTPVNWYQATSPLKLMIDRLVCADGGNPDPTLTHGKNARRAKEIELQGWDYPRHLAGRQFGVVVHGDVAGTENLRRMLVDWMCFMHMEPAGMLASIDRYIGYYEPYATSHAALDRDTDVQEEVRNAARQLLDTVRARRRGEPAPERAQWIEPRQK